jgi:hypothetical protein
MGTAGLGPGIGIAGAENGTCIGVAGIETICSGIIGISYNIFNFLMSSYLK